MESLIDVLNYIRQGTLASDIMNEGTYLNLKYSPAQTIRPRLLHILFNAYAAYRTKWLKLNCLNGGMTTQRCWDFGLSQA